MMHFHFILSKFTRFVISLYIHNTRHISRYVGFIRYMFLWIKLAHQILQTVAAQDICFSHFLELHGEFPFFFKMPQRKWKKQRFDRIYDEIRFHFVDIEKILCWSLCWFLWICAWSSSHFWCYNETSFPILHKDSWLDTFECDFNSGHMFFFHRNGERPRNCFENNSFEICTKFH